MAGETVRVEVGTASSAETRRIAAENGGILGLTREQAAELLAARGVMPPSADGKPVYTAPVPEPDQYRITLPENMQIADGATPEGIQAGAAEWCAALGVSPLLGNVLVEDILGSDAAPDPAAIKTSLGNMNRDVGQTYRDAEYALARASQRLGGDFVKATELPLRSLVHLADHGRLMRRREGR